MKVNIGPYIHYIGPYQIAEAILFWMDRHEDERVHKFGNFLAHGFYRRDPNQRDYLFDPNEHKTWLYRLCEWIHEKRKRRIKVKIDCWDTWSMDHTLALIALPMLKKLREDTQGAPFVDDEDVPEDLRSTAAPAKANEYDTDDNHFARWDYVLDEMIYAFEQSVSDDEPDFWITRPEGMYFERCKDNSQLSEMKYDVEGELDREAYEAYHARIKNGFRLFGKYYQGLWT